MFKFIKSMGWFIKKNWWRYLLVIFFGLILAFLNVFPIRLIGNLTKAIEEGNVTREYLIYDIMIPYICIVLGIYIDSVIKRTCQNRLTTTLYYALHDRYMKSILTQDGHFFERFQSGDLLVRAIGDINTVKFSGGNRLLNIFLDFVTVIVAFVELIRIDWLLAIICFIPLIFILISNMLLKAKVQKNWKIVREKSSLMGNVVLESITNVRTIRAYSKEEDSYKKNLEYSKVVYEVEKSNLKINVIFQPLFQFIVGISTLLCLAFGAYFYHIGRLAEISLVVSFSMYLGLFQAPLSRMGAMINNFYQSLISAERLNEVYNSRSGVVVTNNIKCEEIKEIEFRNFYFNYPNEDEEILKGINLVIKKGETIGVVGKTGSGKSTLIRQLERQYPIMFDGIYINGIEIAEYNKESIRERVAYVPQEHVLFSRSVYDNVKLGKKNAKREEINMAIRLADFEKDVENLSDGLNTIVGEYGVTLSGGQKQRLGIARALLKNQDVLILDDSLSAVDGRTEANIIDSLKEYRSDKTNIIVCHRLSAVMHADMIIVLDNGVIIERGNHEELMALKGWYYEQFMNQKMTGGDTHES
ncbi:MAG: ABC transporter ATP-binding protein [Acholeplasmatales bacterium]|nr:ABC transporter ATP-binding protein [Acholeplasmatales bacterium]